MEKNIEMKTERQTDRQTDRQTEKVSVYIIQANISHSSTMTRPDESSGQQTNKTWLGASAHPRIRASAHPRFRINNRSIRRSIGRQWRPGSPQTCQYYRDRRLSSPARWCCGQVDGAAVDNTVGRHRYHIRSSPISRQMAP